MPNPLENIKKRLAEIQARYDEWAAPIKKADLDNTFRINRSGYNPDDKNDAKAWKYLEKCNPYQDSLAIMQELSSLYLGSDEEQRAAIRDVLLMSQFWQWMAPMNFMWRKIDELKANPDGEILRMALAAASIQNCCVDYRDVVVVLHDMFKAAQSVGIDPIPYFAEMAELSSDELPLGSFESMRAMINRFCNRSTEP